MDGAQALTLMVVDDEMMAAHHFEGHSFEKEYADELGRYLPAGMSTEDIAKALDQYYADH